MGFLRGPDSDSDHQELSALCPLQSADAQSAAAVYTTAQISADGCDSNRRGEADSDLEPGGTLRSYDVQDCKPDGSGAAAATTNVESGSRGRTERSQIFCRRMRLCSARSGGFWGEVFVQFV